MIAKDNFGKEIALIDSQKTLILNNKKQIQEYMKRYHYNPNHFSVIMYTGKKQKLSVKPLIYILNIASIDVINTFHSVNKSSWISYINKMFHHCFPKAKNNLTLFFKTDKNSQFIILHTDKKPVAFCFLRHDGYIHTVCVNANFRGQGLCSKLMEYVTKTYNHMNLFLHVRIGPYMGQGLPLNKTAYKCYQKYGFLGIKGETCAILDDGINCTMVRPPYGEYNLSLYSKNIQGEQFDTTKTDIQIAKGVHLVKNKGTIFSLKK